MSDRKLCVIYTNCQGKAVGHFLNKSLEYRSKFHTVYWENYLVLSGDDKIDIGLLQKTDLFIYQPLSKKYNSFSTRTLKKFLPDRCKIIAFPYIYNNALWPLFIDGGGTKIVGAKSITNLIDSGYNLHEIIKAFLSLSIDFNFAKRYLQTINILKDKETKTDIKVSDYITRNIRHEKLFLTQNHPTSTLLLHTVNQMLNILGIMPLSKEDIVHPNEAELPNCWPVSPYDHNYYCYEYSYDWGTFYATPKDGNWRNFYLKIIGKIYFNYTTNNKLQSFVNRILLRISRELSKFY